MLRPWTVRALLFLALVLVALAVLVGYSLFLAPPRPDSLAQVRAWLDGNANGIVDAGEPPLQGVCVWAGYASTSGSFSSWQEICKQSYHKTDGKGEWTGWFPGGSCDEIHILVNPPEGYQLTTPATVNGCVANFGLVRGTSPAPVQVPVAEQYLQKQALLGSIRRLLPLAAIVVAAAAVAFLLVRPRRQGK